MLESWGCGLYTTAAPTQVFTVFAYWNCKNKTPRHTVLAYSRINWIELNCEYWKVSVGLMSKMYSFLNFSPLNTTVSRKMYLSIKSFRLSAFPLYTARQWFWRRNGSRVDHLSESSPIDAKSFQSQSQIERVTGQRTNCGTLCPHTTHKDIFIANA